MESPFARFVYWAPRLLGIIFALFLCVLAADVFGESRGFWATAGALLMHLMPVFLVVLVLALAWRHDLVGAVLFMLLGALYLLFAVGRMHWSAMVAISGPLFVIGLLFVSNWWFTRRAGPTSPRGAAAQ